MATDEETYSAEEVVVFGPADPPSSPPDLRILHFNDVYHLDPGSAEPAGGAARFATVVDEYRSHPRFAGQPPLVVLFSGDAFNPSLESSVTKGSHMVPVLNELGVDCACVGNHDLDFGTTQFAHLASQCTFPWLLANVLDQSLGIDIPLANAGKTHVIHVPTSSTAAEASPDSGLRIGVVGLGEREWLETLNSLPPQIDYRSASATARELVPGLRSGRLGKEGDAGKEEGGCAFIVALTHQREPNDVKLAENTGDIVDLVLGGHDHFYSHQLVGGRTSVLRSGTDFKDLSYIEVRRPKDEVSSKDAEAAPRWDLRIVRRSLMSSVSEEPHMAELVGSLTSSLKQSLEKPIGWTLSPLDARFITVRLAESNLGNFVCDIMRHHYAYAGADCALMAGGTIRGDQIYPPGAIRVKDVTDCFPFEDPCVVLGVKGQQLWDALENGVSLYPALEGRFLQVSNIIYSFDPDRPRGKRIVDAQVGGQPLDRERRYVLATRGYMAKGKDGFTSLLSKDNGGTCEELVSDENGILISMLLRQYFMALKVFGQWKQWSPSMDRHWTNVVSSVEDCHPTVAPTEGEGATGPSTASTPSTPPKSNPAPQVRVTFNTGYNESQADGNESGTADVPKVETDDEKAAWKNWTPLKVRERQASVMPLDESDVLVVPRKSLLAHRRATMAMPRGSSFLSTGSGASRSASSHHAASPLAQQPATPAVPEARPEDTATEEDETQEAKDLRRLEGDLRLMRKFMAKWLRIVGVSPKMCDSLREVDVAWTKAVAPRVEGRIINLKAVREDKEKKKGQSQAKN